MPCRTSVRVFFPCTVLTVGSMPRVILLISMTGHCPLSLILGSHNVFTVLLIFPGSGSGGVPKRVSRPGSVFFLLTAVCLKTPFFQPLHVLLSLHCSLRCLLDHFISGTGYCPFHDLERFVHTLPAARTFSANIVKEWTPSFFGLPVSSHPRKKAATMCASLRRIEAPWALGSFVWCTQAAASGAVCNPWWILGSCDQARSCCLTWHRSSESQIRHAS